MEGHIVIGIQMIEKAFNDNPEFGRLLNHPEVEKGEKEGLINNIFSQFVSGDMTGLLITMVSND